MIDTLTHEIIEQMNGLPIIKKKAILELIKKDSFSIRRSQKNFQEKWRNKLLTTSVWTDSEINEINKAREYINQWKPKQLL